MVDNQEIQVRDFLVQKLFFGTIDWCRDWNAISTLRHILEKTISL